MNTQELLHQIQRNDSEEAFRTLFDTQYDRMFRIAYYFLQDDEWAKEVVLDVLADIWVKRKTMIVPDDFRHYSFVAVKHAALNVLTREERLRERQAEMADESKTAIIDYSPEELAEQSELFEAYESLLSDLPERCRMVFCRVKEDGMSYAEVASEMGISVKTVDAQLQKALKHLREGLSRFRDGENRRRFYLLFL